MEKETPTKEPPTEVEDIGKGLPSIDQVEGTEVESTEETHPRRGRPPKDIETVKRVPFSVSLSPKLVSRIIDQAEEEDVSRSELINGAITFYLDTHKPGQEYIVLEEESFRKILREAFREFADKKETKSEPSSGSPEKHGEKARSVKETDSGSEKEEEDEDGIGILGIHL